MSLLLRPEGDPLDIFEFIACALPQIPKLGLCGPHYVRAHSYSVEVVKID